MNANSGRTSDDAHGQVLGHLDALEPVLVSFSIASILQCHALKIPFIRLGKQLTSRPIVHDAVVRPL